MLGLKIDDALIPVPLGCLSTMYLSPKEYFSFLKKGWETIDVGIGF